MNRNRPAIGRFFGYTRYEMEWSRQRLQGNLVKLTLPADEFVTVYFRGSSQRPTIPPSFHLYLQPVDLFYGKVLQKKVAKALFIGFLGMSEQIRGYPQETELIRRNGGDLMRLINQLLDLSRLESGSMPLSLVRASGSH